MFRVLHCLFSLVCTTSFALGQESSVAVPVSGEPFAAEVAGIDGEWNIAFGTEAGRRTLAAAELVRWGTAPELGAGPLLVLADGGVLAAEVRAIDGEQVTAETLLFSDVRLPLARLRGVVFRAPADRLERDRLLNRVRTATGARDRLLLENGDVIEGTLAGGGSPAVVGPPAPQDRTRMETLRMHVADGAADVPVRRVTALIFNPSLVESSPPRGLRAWLGFQDDGLLLADQVQSQSGLTTITLPGGAQLRTDEAGFRQGLQLVQPIGGQAVYLSDLTPLGYRHIPYLTLPWDYGQDRNVLGGRLRSGGKIYVKGMGMHSTSRLAYRLDGDYQRFKAELALDDAAGREGSVVYRVYTADAGGQWKPAYESPVIRGGDAPTPISVNIADAKGLALIVEHADRGDVQDYANWLDARVEGVGSSE